MQIVNQSFCAAKKYPMHLIPRKINPGESIAAPSGGTHHSILLDEYRTVSKTYDESNKLVSRTMSISDDLATKFEMFTASFRQDGKLNSVYILFKDGTDKLLTRVRK